jgi:hypothetical protein
VALSVSVSGPRPLTGTPPCGDRTFLPRDTLLRPESDCQSASFYNDCPTFARLFVRVHTPLIELNPGIGLSCRSFRVYPITKRALDPLSYGVLARDPGVPATFEGGFEPGRFSEGTDRFL